MQLRAFPSAALPARSAATAFVKAWSTAPGQLDAVVLLATEWVTGEPLRVAALVSRQEPDRRREPRMLAQEGRGLDRFGARESSPPIRTK